MKKNNNKKVHLSVVFLIIILIIILIGFFIYKKYNDNLKIVNNFKLDSENKYKIITELILMNDGGSSSILYYQIDLDNGIVSKVKNHHGSPLISNPPKEYTHVYYVKKINTNIQEEIRLLLNELITNEDIYKPDKYDRIPNSFSISTLNTEKAIYNKNSINRIKLLLEKIDELKY